MRGLTGLSLITRLVPVEENPRNPCLLQLAVQFLEDFPQSRRPLA